MVKDRTRKKGFMVVVSAEMAFAGQYCVCDLAAGIV